MSFINKYDPLKAIYKDTTFVGYSLTGLVVVSLDADSTQFRGISGDTIVKNFENKRPVVLSFNPVYMYIAFLLVVLYALTVRYGKFK